MGIVEMLMGEVPDLASFNSCAFFSSIISYLDLIKAVKKGDLSEFKNVCSKYESVFIKDGNYTLIQRLRQVVLKIGLRKINLSYSRISFEKINEILNPEDPSDIDLILSKAIRDGVFLGKIDQEKKYVESRDIQDIYSTFDPQNSFKMRIEFLNKIHNDGISAMKFPENKQKEAKNDGELEEDVNMDTAYMDF